MMTLGRASSFFDTNTFTDAHSASTFVAQLLGFTDNTRSGSTAKRRILSTALEVTIPARRTVISPGNQAYIVALSAEDLFANEVVRLKYPVVPADYQYTVRTIGQVLAGSGGVTDAYLALSYMAAKSVDDQSENISSYNAYHASDEPLSKGDILFGNSKYFRTMERSRTDDAGFGVSHVTELEDPVSSATFISKGALNARTDTYDAAVTILDVATFTEHPTQNYENEALGFVSIEPGDKVISFLKSQVATVVPSDTVGGYNILSVVDNGTFWTTHARL